MTMKTHKHTHNTEEIIAIQGLIDVLPYRGPYTIRDCVSQQAVSSFFVVNLFSIFSSWRNSSNIQHEIKWKLFS